MHPSKNKQAVQNPQVLIEISKSRSDIPNPPPLYVNLYPKGMYLVSCDIHPPFWKTQTPHGLTCRTPSCHLSACAASIAEVQQLLLFGPDPGQQMMWPTDAVPVHTSWGKEKVPLWPARVMLSPVPPWWYPQSTILSRLWAEDGCPAESLWSLPGPCGDRLAHSPTA